ncbi:MAG: malto-oligosyltrehalose trehalohydrolase [Candidatus Dormibacteraeota bacterium]|nr:malto-oligosyltrehalose trehalohydrolase [Candidatus Dormibacteraeota bacterium]
MSQTRVWVPRAGGVELVAGPRRDAMQPEARGWWSAPAVAPGRDYAFSIDGAEPLPDPRSPWQPSGVHGPSRALDHGDFAWSDQGWRGRELATAVVYELHVGTFTPQGTVDAVIGKLDHLVELGVDTVELMPVAEFPGDRGWGYDGVDLWAPHHAYGGPAGLKRLVDACHGRGLAVVLDVVYNHVGPEGNHLEPFGPYFTSRHRTPWGKALNFDGRSARPVRDFVIENALMWLRDYHLDGLRLDAVHAIVDSSRRHIVEELASRVHELGEQLERRLWVVGEEPAINPRLLGFGVDGQWTDTFHHALHVLLTGERQGYYAPFGTVADLSAALLEPRSLGLPYTRFLGYSQNHDQVGNRGAGERLSQLVDGRRLRLAAALVLLSPFVPMLFMGEEWGASTPFLFFSDHRDPRIARATSRGRVEEFKAFGWRPEDVPDPQAPASFERSKLDWSEIARDPHRSLLEWYRALIRLRRRLAGSPVELSHEGAVLIVRRGEVRVICDFEGGDVRVEGGVEAGIPNA